MITAEDARYWKTGNSSPDVWLDKTAKLIEDFGADLLFVGFGDEPVSGRAAYTIRFTIQQETFHLIWPVLRSEPGGELSARRQAATMLHHAVKARLVEAEVLGVRLAFFSWLQLPDGRAMYQLSDDELLDKVPQVLLPSPKDTRLLEEESAQ